MALAALEESSGEKDLLQQMREQPKEGPQAVIEQPKAAETKPEETKLAEAAKPAETPPPAEQKKPERVVPIQALHEERRARQELERRLKDLEAKGAQPKVDEPDETQDPIGAISRLKQEVAQYRQAQEQAKAEQALGAKVGARIRAYAAEHPEYPEQHQFLLQSRVAEMRLLGHDDASIAQSLRAEEMSLGQMAIDRDLDPGQLIAEMAKARGWQPKTPAKQEEAKPDPKIDTPTIKEAEQAIERLERGQRAAKSSSSSGGGAAPTGDLSIEEIANLNGAAFDSAMAKYLRQAKDDPSAWR